MKAQVRNPKAAPPAKAGGKSAGELVRASNRWRDNYNPLRHLVISRAVALLEAAERGDYAELQLALRKIERRYPVLKALIARRCGAIEKLTWDVKVPAALPAGATPELAEAQRAHLRARYDLVANLTDAFGQLALAEFRGFTILQKHRFADGANDGAVRELHWLPQFTWSRDGQFGDFFYNAESRMGVGLGSCVAVLGEANRLPLRAGKEGRRMNDEAGLVRSDFVLRECDAPLYEIALVAFVNWCMGRKDWAAFVEIFGLPNSVVIMPPNVPAGQEDAQRAAAEKVAEGISGALPAGSDVKFPTASVRGSAPFKEFCDAQDADVVLAGTGGLLTMLSLPTGIGGGASGEHGDAFADIALADARRITAALQADFDGPELDEAFPGQPHLAYFELSAQDEDDVKELVTHAVALKGAGYVVKAEWLAEQTGYELEAMGERSTSNVERSTLNVGSSVADAPLQNRADTQPSPIQPSTRHAFGKALAADLQPYLTALQERVDRILTINDPALRAAKLAAAFAELEPLKKDLLADPASARQMQALLGEAMAAGFATGPVANRRVWNTEHAPAGSPEGGQFTRGAGGAASPKPSPAPPRISAQEADELLTKGFSEQDAAGREVKFGARLKDHFDQDHTPAEAQRRKEHLPWARETVRSGTRVEHTDAKTGEVRAHYGKFFSDGTKEKGFLSIVDTKDGEAFTAFRAPRRYLEKLGITNRAGGDEPGEQPPVAVLQAIAAAGGLPDWCQFSGPPQKGKP